MTKQSQGEAKSSSGRHSQEGAPERAASPVHQRAAPTTPAVAARSLRAQARRLGDVHVQRAQRHAMAAQIGRVHGNRHVGRVIASMAPRPAAGKTPARATPQAIGGDPATDLVTDLGGSGPPTMTGARPPNPHGSLEGRVVGPAPQARREAQPAAVIQREGPEGSARAAAQGLLGRLTGQADAAQGQVRQASTQGDAQARAQGADQQQALEVNAQAASAQIESQANTQTREIDAQAGAGRAQLQAQGAGAAAQLQGEADALQAEAAVQSVDLEADVQARTSALEADAAGVAPQVGAEWATQRARTVAETDVLQAWSNATQEESRQQAQEALAQGGAGGKQEAERIVGGGWVQLAERVGPVEELARSLRQLLGRWVRRYWLPRQRRIEEVRDQIRRGVRVVWSRLQRRAARLLGTARGVIQQLLSLRQRLRDRLRRMVRTGLARMRDKAARGINGLVLLRNRVRNLVREAGRAAIRRLRERADSAMDRVRRLAAPIVRFFAGPVNAILSRVRRIAAPAVSLLRRGVNQVRDRLLTVGRAVWSRLRGKGRRVMDGLRSLGGRVFGLVGRVAGGALRIVGRAAGRIRALRERLRDRLIGLGGRLLDRLGSLPSRLRALILDPIVNLVQTSVAALRERVRAVLGRIRQAWSALRRWVRGAGHGTGPAQGGPTAAQGSQAGTQQTAQGG
ncbi:MAG: hypothetical protein JXA09_18200 [Anaerolineae bacterium]|nr:hypothetical protein [Anaerolineae bacterium]